MTTPADVTGRGTPGDWGKSAGCQVAEATETGPRPGSAIRPVRPHSTGEAAVILTRLGSVTTSQRWLAGFYDGAVTRQPSGNPGGNVVPGSLARVHPSEGTPAPRRAA